MTLQLLPEPVADGPGNTAGEPAAPARRASPGSARFARVVGSNAFGAALMAAALYSYQRGAITVVQDWGRPFFSIDYSSGPIKRGLVGQVAGLLIDRGDEEAMTRAILGAHLVLAGLLIHLLIEAARSIGRAGSHQRAAVNCVLVLLIGSQLLPTTAYNTGYFDVYIFVVYAVLALVIPADRPIWASAVASVGLLIHEVSLFFFLSFVVLSATRAAGRGELSRALALRLLALPGLTALLLYALHSNSAAATEVEQTAAADEIKAALINVQFGQTLPSALKGMARHWTLNTGNGVVATLYYTLPALVMLALYWAWRQPGRRATLALLASSFTPLLILTIAWDLSRFLVTAQLTTAVSILYWERHRLPALLGSTSRPLRWAPLPRLLPAVVPLAVALLAFPLTYSYFEVTYLIRGDLTPAQLDDLTLRLLN